MIATRGNRIRRWLPAAFIAAGILVLFAFAVRPPAQAQESTAPPGPAARGSRVLAPLHDPSQGEVDEFIKKTGLVESDKPVRDMVPGWTPPKMMLVHVDRPDRLAWLQKAVPGVKLVGVYQRGNLAQKEAEAMPYAADADAFIYALPEVLCTENLIKAAKNLKWIHYYGAGIDDCTDVSPEVASGKFLFTNSQKLFNPWIAGNIFAMMISLMRGIDLFVHMDMDQHIRQPNFGERGWQIQGRTLLVVGLGGIGTELAKMAHGVGMKVIATRETSHEGPDYVDYVGLSGELPDLVGKADVVAATVPLTPETKGLFNAAMFARMKRGAIFVSISREDVVAEPDLVAALKSGQIGAAGMNVNTGGHSPLPDHDPLWSAPNMLVISHGGAPTVPAGGMDTSDDNIWMITREEMRRYATGGRMLSVVDVKRGY